MAKIKVVELFAGVGGFRLGLEKSNFQVVWSNQWEPMTKTQHASDVYEYQFGKDNHSNEDINTVKTKDIPDHDMLVGGFPCQDYSVATVSAKGMEGKKGVLWWDINRIISEKNPELIEDLALIMAERQKANKEVKDQNKKLSPKEIIAYYKAEFNKKIKAFFK